MALTYATWNPSDKNANITLSGWDLTASNSFVNHVAVRSTIWKSTWKWYWEINVISNVWTILIWVGNSSMSIANGSYVGSDINWWGYHMIAQKYTNASPTAYGATYTNSDIIGVALDMDWWTITMYKNNTSQWTMYSSLTGTLFPSISLFWVSSLSANFWASTMTYTAPAGYNQWLYNWSLSNSSFLAFM